MPHADALRGLRCLACDAALAKEEDALVCSVCGRLYPAPQGIPLLVRDCEYHLAMIDEASAVKPNWYVMEQPPEAASPWRHHLRRHRLYVSAVLRREIARRALPPEFRLLDLGCGDGNNMAWLKDFGGRLYGSDYNLTRLARAQHLVPEATCFLADILDYPAPDGFFDVIFFNHVIEHIPNDLAALREVCRILSPRGLLILGAPNEGCWWWQLAYRRDPESLRTTDHVHFYTRRTLSARMAEAGLDVFESKGLGFGPPDWRLDGKIRKYEWVDDLFECLGQTFMPSQASSLYLLANKAGGPHAAH